MPLKLPLYAKMSFILLSLSVVIVFLYFGQHIFIPIFLSILFAILLRPVVHFFNKSLKFPHVFAVLVSVIVFILFIATIVFFVSWQISDITNDWYKIKHNLAVHFENFQEWINQQFRISYNKQKKYIEQATEGTLTSGREMVGNTLSSFSGILLNIVLIPIYTFLILLYRTLLIKFLSLLLPENQQRNLEDILMQIKHAIQNFLLGLIFEMVIVATLTTVGLMIIGLQYALLLGVITGILNLIPYVGILFAALLTIIASLTNSTDLSMIVGVIIVNASVQLIDNNILIPLVVSSKVRINGLVSIIGIIIGGAIGGVAGMFLAIPIIAILKVICDHIEVLTPWGFLMGDDLPKTYEWHKLKLPSFDAGNSHDTENFKNTKR